MTQLVLRTNIYVFRYWRSMPFKQGYLNNKQLILLLSGFWKELNSVLKSFHEVRTYPCEFNCRVSFETSTYLPAFLHFMPWGPWRALVMYFLGPSSPAIYHFSYFMLSRKQSTNTKWYLITIIAVSHYQIFSLKYCEKSAIFCKDCCTRSGCFSALSCFKSCTV